jgi:hypothetical protein
MCVCIYISMKLHRDSTQKYVKLTNKQTNITQITIYPAPSRALLWQTTKRIRNLICRPPWKTSAEHNPMHRFDCWKNSQTHNKSSYNMHTTSWACKAVTSGHAQLQLNSDQHTRWQQEKLSMWIEKSPTRTMKFSTFGAGKKVLRWGWPIRKARSATTK